MTFQIGGVSWEQLISWLCLSALCWVAAPAPVAAQAEERPQPPAVLSRAALLEAARRAAVDSVVEPQRAAVETGLHRFAQFRSGTAKMEIPVRSEFRMIRSMARAVEHH